MVSWTMGTVPVTMFFNTQPQGGEGAKTLRSPTPASPEDRDHGYFGEPGDTLRGSETVLFVDDEDMIIEVAGELFEQLGYKILTARSGKEAIEIYEKTKNRLT